MTDSSAPTTGIVDTNILIYASDPAAGTKRDRALELIERLRERGLLRLSIQPVLHYYITYSRWAAWWVVRRSATS